MPTPLSKMKNNSEEMELSMVWNSDCIFDTPTRRELFYWLTWLLLISPL